MKLHGWALILYDTWKDPRIVDPQMEDHEGAGCHLQAKEMGLRKPTMPTPPSWTFSLPSEGNKVSCSSHSAWNNLWWQLQEMNAMTSSSFPTELLHSWMPGCPWSMTVHFTDFAWQGGIMEEASTPAFSRLVPCLGRFYWNFLSMT